MELLPTQSLTSVDQTGIRFAYFWVLIPDPEIWEIHVSHLTIHQRHQPWLHRCSVMGRNKKKKGKTAPYEGGADNATACVCLGKRCSGNNCSGETFRHILATEREGKRRLTQPVPFDQVCAITNKKYVTIYSTNAVSHKSGVLKLSSLSMDLRISIYSY